MPGGVVHKLAPLGDMNLSPLMTWSFMRQLPWQQRSPPAGRPAGQCPAADTNAARPRPAAGRDPRPGWRRGSRWPGKRANRRRCSLGLLQAEQEVAAAVSVEHRDDGVAADAGGLQARVQGAGRAHVLHRELQHDQRGRAAAGQCGRVVDRDARCVDDHVPVGAAGGLEQRGRRPVSSVRGL